MEIDTLIKLLKDYDLVTVALMAIIYVYLKKQIGHVDKAVNNRSSGDITLSQEVTEIHRKLDIMAVRVEYLVKEIDAHRKEDERLFIEITKDIKGIHKRITELK